MWTPEYLVGVDPHLTAQAAGPASKRFGLASPAQVVTALKVLSLGAQGFDRDGLQRHRKCKPDLALPLALPLQLSLTSDLDACDLFLFRIRAGSLGNILFHDGFSISLYAKELKRGRFA